MERGFPTKTQMQGVSNKLLDMDWVTRHQELAVWRERNHLAYCRLLTMLGPDQAHSGVDEGRPPSYLYGVSVAAPPATPKRQLTLEETFARQVVRRRD